MSKMTNQGRLWDCLWILSFFLMVLTATRAFAQAGTQGTVSVTVTDVSGGMVPKASLQLVQTATNSTRKAQTGATGTFDFVNLPIGVYRLRTQKSGYATTVNETIIVHAAQTTPVPVLLKLGQASQTVTVDASATPLLDTTSNAIGMVIDLKAIEDLPLAGRNLMGLTQLTPGYTDGVWNGQPFSNQGSNVDGVIGAPSRGKYNGNATPSVTPRIEDIAEMSIQTDQLDLDSGFGRATMQINFVTRSGTNAFHGRIFDNFRNSGLFANSWTNNATGQRRAKQIYNDFGGSLGGPILRDKLFFFGSFATRRIPGQISASNDYLTTAMQAGNFTYVGTDGNTYTKNLLQLANQYSPNLPDTVNSVIATQLGLINTSLASGATSGTSDPNINNINWNTNAPDIYYYPTVRVDYNATDKVRMNLAWNMTQETHNGLYPANFPGSDFSDQSTGYSTKNYTAAYGLDWQLTNNLINQLKLGFLYNVGRFSAGAKDIWATQPTIYWGLDNYGTWNMSGQTYSLPVTEYYPVLNAADTMSWQKGAHSFKFGFSWNREQDHYWNPPAGFPNYYLGLAAGDPAINAFSNGSSGSLPYASSTKLAEAQQMYAVLAGRISGVGGTYAYSASTNSYEQKIAAYNLDELQSAWGVYFQDSYRVRPDLTLNYGLRWDFTGDNHDLTGAYHSSSEASIYGPSGVGNLFNPGVLSGTNNPTVDAHVHVYAPWNVSPQPAFGFAWNPKGGDGVMGKLLGNGNTVIRGGYNLRRFTMPQQYYWNNASSYGAFFYQNFYLNANTTGQTGTFTPGSLSLGNSLPAYGFAPASYVNSEALSDFTFLNTLAVTGIDPHIKQPYTQSWNFGIERRFGSRALEIRYNGNRTLHQWLAVDPNEVNIFENGFLAEFKKAQANYAANHAAGVESFANNGLAGQSNLPIFQAAFAGEASGGQGVGPVDFANSEYLNYLQTGQAGAMANVLSGVNGTTTYFCNLVGSSFAPCANNAGYAGTGAGYPVNFFQANPYAAGSSTSYMVAAGYSNYHSLQVDFRQQSWKGLVFDANYTFGKTLAVSSTRCWTGCGDNIMTLRDMRKGYGPTPYDIRQVMHFTATYDLPFGVGKAFLNSNGLLSRFVGGWTVGSIMTFQTGAAQQIYGGNYTYNDYADGGIRLTGVSRSQLQKAVGVHRIPGQTYATLLDPKYLQSASGDGANTNYINPNTTPGTIGDVLFLYGPHSFYHDMSLSKSVAIHDSLKFKLQGEFLNVWNHPVFGSTPYSFGSSVQSSSFATGSVTNSPRTIELRGNLEF